MTTTVLRLAPLHRYTIATLLFVMTLVCCLTVEAQRPAAGGELSTYPKGSASGTLTVTATVVTSVGIIMGSNGEPILIVANPSDPADNVSRMVMLDQSSNREIANGKMGATGGSRGKHVRQ